LAALPRGEAAEVRSAGRRGDIRPELAGEVCAVRGCLVKTARSPEPASLILASHRSAAVSSSIAGQVAQGLIRRPAPTLDRCRRRIAR